MYIVKVTKIRAEVKRWRVYLFLFPRTGNLVVLYGPAWGPAQGPFVSAAPSLRLRLYVWMPLRQDVKVCGPESARSGMNSFTF